MRPLFDVTVISSSCPVWSTFAYTLRIPLVSTRIVTLIVTWPRGRGGISLISKTPSFRLSSKNSASPSQRRSVTHVWSSREFAKHSVYATPSGGMGVDAGMTGVAKERERSLWFAVAMHSGRGTTSTISTEREASIAAPITIASSGLIRRQISVPGNNSCSRSCTLGIREEPPTKSTWSMSRAYMPPCTFMRARSTGASSLRKTGSTICSISSRDKVASNASPSMRSSTHSSDSNCRDRSILIWAQADANFL
mmetsp:Transcript_47540/g.76616  ORF Transcript_47540/g.76616 Transcript_47540/m.76616 type:complete len:252 (+) Transcript_47540:206-961(+)